jgi:hypothetical protein
VNRFYHLAFDGVAIDFWNINRAKSLFGMPLLTVLLAPFLLIGILFVGRSGYNDCDVRCRYRHVCVVRMPSGSWAMPEPDAIPK